MKRRILLFVIAIISLTALSITDAEARRKPAMDKKNNVDKPLASFVHIENPSAVTYDSVGNAYFISDYGDMGFYPHFLNDPVDSSDWDGGVYYVSNDEVLYSYKLPIMLDNPSSMEIVADTLYVADRFRIFLINLNTDSTIKMIYINTGAEGLTDMAKDTSGYLYISSFDLDSIFKYNVKTREISRLVCTGEPLDSIGSMVFERRDNSLIIGTYKNKSKILKLNLNTMNVTVAKETAIKEMSGIDTDKDGNVYVSQSPRSDNDETNVTKFRADFSGDSTVMIYGGVNLSNQNIYYNKNEDRLILTNPQNSTVYFVDMKLFQDTVKLDYPKDSATNVETDIEFRFHPLANNSVFNYILLISKNQNVKSYVRKEYIYSSDTSIIITGLDTSTTYYWTVIASSDLIKTRNYKVRKFKTKGEFIVPSGIYPADSAMYIDSNVKFRWSAPNSAKSYILETYYDKYGQKRMLEIKVDTNTIVVDDFTTDSTYFWRVKAVGDSGASSWSKLYKFTTSSPNLASPQLINPYLGLEENENDVDFEWANVNWATNYIIKVINDLTDETVAKLHLDTTACTINDLDSNSHFQWSVKAYNSSGTSPWTRFPYQFSTADTTIFPPSPFPISPDGKPVDVNPIFTWQNTNAQSYKLQLAEIKKDPKTGVETADFIHPVYANESIESTQLKLPTNLKNSAKYEWKVKAVYDKKRRSGWSTPSSFETKAIVSVNEPNTNDKFEVYPNPATNDIQIKLSNVNGIIRSIEITDLFGQKIKEIMNLQNDSETFIYNFNIENINAGIYFVSVHLDNSIMSKKLIITR